MYGSVLPEPVPSEINMLYPACTNIRNTDATPASTLPITINASISIRCFGNRRIVITGPPSDTGLVTMHTRAPAGNIQRKTCLSLSRRADLSRSSEASSQPVVPRSDTGKKNCARPIYSRFAVSTRTGQSSASFQSA